MTRTPLTLAISHYDHVVDLVCGRVPVEGVKLNALSLPIIEIFYRFLMFREFDVAEISMAKYVSMRSQGDDCVSAWNKDPVFGVIGIQSGPRRALGAARTMIGGDRAIFSGVGSGERTKL